MWPNNFTEQKNRLWYLRCRERCFPQQPARVPQQWSTRASPNSTAGTSHSARWSSERSPVVMPNNYFFCNSTVNGDPTFTQTPHRTSVYPSRHAFSGPPIHLSAGHLFHEAPSVQKNYCCTRINRGSGTTADPKLDKKVELTPQGDDTGPACACKCTCFNKYLNRTKTCEGGPQGESRRCRNRSW